MHSHSDVTIRVVPLAFDLCAIHVNHAPYCNSSKKRSPYSKRQASRKLQLSKHDSLYHLSVPFKLFVSSMCGKVFAEVINSVTQLEEIMFPHLNSMGLGFGLNVNSMC